MINVKIGVDAEAVKQGSRHTLFVEGTDSLAIDPEVLSRLFNQMPIRVLPLGPSFHVNSAAQALHPHHPDYYFLIDRDHYGAQIVADSWTNFPNPETHNLIIWKRRELENYFLSPAYLVKSQYAICPAEIVAKTLCKAANERLFLEAANMTITSIREDFKTNWISHFTKKAGCETYEKAEVLLLGLSDFDERKKATTRGLSKATIKRRFNAAVELLTGGNTEILFDQGDWINSMRGKKLLPTIISKCFRVPDAKGVRLQGTDAMMEVVKDLLGLPLEQQPDDFRELFSLINSRVTHAN